MSSEIEVVPPQRLVCFSRMWERLELSREESDVSYFLDLLNLGELTLKVVCAGMLAASSQTREGHRYRLEHRLVHADSLGDWAAALEQLLKGPAHDCLLREAQQEISELTQLFGPQVDSWQRRAVDSMQRVADVFSSVDSRPPDAPTKVSALFWATLMAWLRNRIKHGSPTSSQASQAAPVLADSLAAIHADFSLFHRSWVYLRQNLNGKHRVVAVGGAPPLAFEELKKVPRHDALEGIHIDLGPSHTRKVPFLYTDADLSDFWVANGGVRVGEAPTFEALSYVTNDVRRIPLGDYLVPPDSFVASETEGRPNLDAVGKTFANLPQLAADYVRRQELERELRDVLLDGRNPVVTLRGAGGIGKTSLALRVAHDLCAEGHFFMALWLSARDVDLLSDGGRLVRPHVTSISDVARAFCDYANPPEQGTKGFKPAEFLARALSDGAGVGPFLLVLDNFETVDSPTSVYSWLNNAIRLPQKLLITTRMRDFKGDYAIAVERMTEEEFEAVVSGTASRLGINSVVSRRYLSDLYTECDGHPYAAKIVLGEVARSRKPVKVERVLAGRDDLLDKLFARTFTSLSAASKRVFLTLCGWRSSIPRAALEAVLLRPGNERFDVEGALERLEQVSLIEITSSGADAQAFISVPLASQLFGQRELRVSPVQSAVEADLQLLRDFGAVKPTGLGQGLEPRVRAFAGRVAAAAAAGQEIGDRLAVLEHVASVFPSAWEALADLASEHPEHVLAGIVPAEEDSLRSLLRERPRDGRIWERLAELYRKRGDYLEEVNCRVQAADGSEPVLPAASKAANIFNQRLGLGQVALDGEEKRALGLRIRSMMEANLSDAGGDDLSRLVWLCVHLRDFEAAERHLRHGLEIEPGNRHLAKLRERSVTGWQANW